LDAIHSDASDKGVSDERTCKRSSPIADTQAGRLTALGMLAASIVHEIRQPLAAILIETSAMQRWLNREKPNVDEVGDGLLRVRALAERGEQIVRSLQSLLQQRSASHGHLSLEDAVHGAIALNKDKFREAGLSISLNMERGLPELYGDRIQIEQAVSNLLLNALDAVQVCSRGSAAVALNVMRREDLHVVVEVLDNGEGFPLDETEVLEKPFVSTKVGGMGLGLAISRLIAEAHSGTIEVSRRKGWTSVRICLPIPVST